MPTQVHAQNKLTEAEYLAIERASESRHELVGGEMFAMTGARLAHGLVVGNVFAALHRQLRQGDCFVVSSDLKVKVVATGDFFYPDVIVACGEPEFAGDRSDILLNPKVIVEVLSESTMNYDRGQKFGSYRLIPSFAEYLLLTQDRRHAEHFERQSDGRWLLSETDAADAVVELRSIGCALDLDEVYHRVAFAPRSP